MARDIGLDVHAASCTLVVIGESGRKLNTHVVETNAKTLVDLIKTIPRPRHLCMEEGTQSAWLYEMLSAHVDELVVEGLRQERRRQGNKDDERDALGSAQRMRTHSIESRVFKDVGCYGRLRELARVHRMHVQDSVRVQNRVKALYRSRGIPTSRQTLYEPENRDEWLRKLPSKTQLTAEMLLKEYDAIDPLRDEAEKQMVLEARKHPIRKVLGTVPGLGPIRVAQMIPIVISPHRFRTKHQLWAYAGLGIVMRSSADWVPDKQGGWTRGNVQQTRGLNQNHNRVLKAIFKGAATTVIGRADESCPIYQHYVAMLSNKVKPNLAKLTIARQIAAISLSVWKKEEDYSPAKVRKTT